MIAISPSKGKHVTRIINEVPHLSHHHAVATHRLLWYRRNFRLSVPCIHSFCLTQRTSIDPPYHSNVDWYNFFKCISSMSVVMYLLIIWAINGAIIGSILVVEGWCTFPRAFCAWSSESRVWNTPQREATKTFGHVDATPHAKLMEAHARWRPDTYARGWRWNWK
jgi:hypothetical protein